jgi:hypothetical protein
MKRWRKMKTAPKDGSAILAYDINDDVTTIFWNGTRWCLCVAGAYADDNSFAPVGWMELQKIIRRRIR